ncbi:hypothetical protein [Psychroflexus montanilacus]|uniref:hypothetical protein n=1 Tax=Psychroflexus montanilacus TaxID=2873598 RepID=UPI001CCFEF2F|nr:hypothetical protein [Psychroflexus montanilacus]MBZ9650610.1 hypothetical protein [Psychroflexus montanilacus]
MSSNNNKPTKRIEYRGKNIRASRTGGVAARKNIAGDGYGATLNTKHGLRLHKRISKGTRLGFQNGNFQFLGRFSNGPFNFNISKSGVSTSVKNSRGSYNLFKPNYSSFNMGGINIRGKNAAFLQLLFFACTLFINLIKLLWWLSTHIIWFILLMIKWFIDFSIGFYNGFNTKKIDTTIN